MELNNQKKTIIFFIILEISLFVIFFSFLPKGVFAGVGESNVTVITYLDIGNVFPELSNITIQNNASSVTLIPNSTKLIYCSALTTDYNGRNDVNHASGVFFDHYNSTYGAADDNNLHYTNSSCTITQDGTYTDWINCTFNVWYYANPGLWNCTIRVNDSFNKEAYGSDTISVSSLLALGLPDSIHYGLVNATEVSLENLTNVTNYGNVRLNLS